MLRGPFNREQRRKDQPITYCEPYRSAIGAHASPIRIDSFSKRFQVVDLARPDRSRMPKASPRWSSSPPSSRCTSLGRTSSVASSTTRSSQVGKDAATAYSGRADLARSNSSWPWGASSTCPWSGCARTMASQRSSTRPWPAPPWPRHSILRPQQGLLSRITTCWFNRNSESRDTLAIGEASTGLPASICS